MKLLLAWFELAVLLVASYGLSFLVLRKKSSSLDAYLLCLRLGVGFSLIIWSTYLCAVLHFLHTGIFFATIFLGLLLTWKKLPSKIDWQLKLRPFTLALLMFIFVGVNAFFVSFPPTFYDSMLYHLAIPAYYIQHGGMVPWLGNFNSNLPLNSEMLFMFSLLGGTVYLPQLLTFAIGILVIVLVGTLYRRGFAGAHPIIPMLIVYAIPNFGFLTTIAKNDIIGIFFLLLGVLVFWEYATKGEARSDLFLCGWFLGMATGTKYTLAFFCLAFLLALILSTPGRLKKRSACLWWILFFMGAAMFPWLAKNLFMTGNPLYPYLNGLFLGKSWNQAQGNLFASIISRGDTSNFWSYFTFPVEIFLKPFRYGITDVYGYLILALLPFIFASPPDRFKRITLGTVLFSVLPLLFFARVPRYYLPAMVLLSLPIAAGIDAVIEKMPLVKKALLPALLVIGLLQLSQQIKLQEKFSLGIRYCQTHLFKKSKHQFEYLNALPYYRAAQMVNHRLGADDTIMLLGEERTFYFHRNFEAFSFNNEHPLLLQLGSDSSPRQILNWLRNKRITYILYCPKGLKRMAGLSYLYHLTDSENAKLNDILRFMTLIYEDDWSRLYQIPGKENNEDQ